MTSTSRLLLAAVCFALALGLPFGRAAGTLRVPDAVLAQPILVVEPGTTGYGPNGEVLAIPGRLRMQYVPLFLPGWSATVGTAALGRATTARVPLVALLAAALLAWRRRSPILARRASLAGGVALVATGVLAAVPSAGAVASILGVVLLATIGAATDPRSGAAGRATVNLRRPLLPPA
jgi:hypothetical protein